MIGVSEQSHELSNSVTGRGTDQYESADPSDLPHLDQMHAGRLLHDRAHPIEELLDDGRCSHTVGIIAGDRPLMQLPFSPLPHPHYGKVSVAATNVEDQSDHLVLPVTHTFMVYDRRVAAATMRFLTTGAFDIGFDPEKPARRW